MGDFLQQLKEMYYKARYADAYTRKDRVPVNITSNPGKEVTGLYNPTAGIIPNPAISMNVPPGSTSNDQQDTLKHELVHHILRNAILPPDNSSMQGRAGNSQAEMPAYMSIYNQNELPAISPEEHARYMQSLSGFLKKTQQEQLENQISQLVTGRAAYANPDLGTYK